MCRVVSLVGGSAVGKDRILRQVLKESIDRIKPIISTTSRPMRNGEIQGKEYNFVSKEKAEEMMFKHEFIEFREYYPTTGKWNDRWIYGISKDSIDLNSDITYIVIVDFEGLKQLEKYLDKYKINHISFYISTSLQERVRRAVNREGKMTDIQVLEVLRRMLDDEKNIVPAKDYCDFVIENETEGDFYNGVSLIKYSIDAMEGDLWRI